LNRSIVVCVVALAAVAGCGKDTVESLPDCSGQFLVAYVRHKDPTVSDPAPDQGDLYLFDYDELGFHLLQNLNTSFQDIHPTLTRNVRFIAFERVMGQNDHDILLYDRCQAGIFPQPGLNSSGIEREPAFSGDGNKLAFVRDTLGRREVRLYDGVAHRLVPLPGIEGTASSIDANPVTNQNASLIAFSRDAGGNDDVLVYDAVNDSIVDYPALATPAREIDPSMTPDGRYVVFASDRGTAGDLDLYLYDLQTRSFVALPPSTNTTFTEQHPSINANADRIVFESNRTGLGGTDLWLLSRGSGTVGSSGSSSLNDTQPWIVWQ
jgi:WD40-like Beta Propeller Repeat